MGKNSKSNFIDLLQNTIQEGALNEKTGHLLEGFYREYRPHALLTVSDEEIDTLFAAFLAEVCNLSHATALFEPYHERVRAPFDYYAFGLNFLRPLVDRSISTFTGKENLREIIAHIEQKHNVIFLSNHQTEADPQALSLILAEESTRLAEEIIFVAGERVITDPLAIPFSMGCNLLCIYSKRYIDHPPEKKHEKQLHNQRTMQLMSALLGEGGKCIYIAPSGGRDRRNPEGKIEIAPFDPKSIEMVYLMAKKSGRPTFFYPMTLGTYEILPPPKTIQLELGEKRSIKREGIHLAIGSQIDMESFPGSENQDKNVRRKSRADYIWGLVQSAYQRFPGEYT